MACLHWGVSWHWRQDVGKLPDGKMRVMQLSTMVWGLNWYIAGASWTCPPSPPNFGRQVLAGRTVLALINN